MGQLATKQESVIKKNKQLCGDALIFSHTEYDPSLKLKIRQGGKEDVENLKKTLSKLGLRVQVFENLSHAAIVRTLEENAKQQLRRDQDCLFVCVLTHGSSGGVLYSFDKEYKTSEFWKPYMKSEALLGKPKIFIFQACRGQEAESTVSNQDSRKDMEERCFKLPSLPNEPNFLFAYSTVEHYKSVRNIYTGTWYISELCKNIENMKEPTGLLEILTKLNNDVTQCGREVSEPIAQTPMFDSFLDRKFSLPVTWVVEETNDASTGDATGDVTKELAPSNGSSTTNSGEKPTNYRWEGLGRAIIVYEEGQISMAEQYGEAIKVFRFDVQYLIIDTSIQENMAKKAEDDMNDIHSLVVVVLAPFVSHPLEETYEEALNVPGSSIPVQNIWGHFTGSCCPQLVAKPKIFFYLQAGGSLSFDDESTSTDKDKISTTDHADMFHFFGRGNDVALSLLNGIQSVQPKDLNSLCTQILGQHREDGILSHFQSTMRHPFVFSSFPTREEYEKDQTKRSQLVNLEESLNEMRYRKDNNTEQYLNILIKYSDKLRDLGYHRDRLTVLDEIIQVSTNVRGAQHAETLAHRHNKAYTLGELGRYEECVTLYDEVIETERRVLGENHVLTLTSMHGKAYALGELRRYEEALTLYNDVIERRRRVLGEDHERTLSSMHEKAYTLDQLGRYEESLTLYNDVIERRLRVLGEDHVDTLRSMHNKAYTLGELGSYAESVALFDRTIEKRTRVLGADHESTVLSVRSRAEVVKKRDQN